MLGSSLERPPEIVEDRDQLLHEPLVRTLGERRLLARVPLAEVVELRREPLQAVEELIAVSLESVDVDALRALAGNPVPGRLSLRDRVALLPATSVITPSEPPAPRR